MDLTEDPFSIIQAITACGVVILDATDEHIVAANQTAAQILGCELDALLRPDGTELPWDERPSTVARRTGQAQSQVLVGVASPDGRRRSLCVDAVPLRRDDGMVGWVVVSFVGVPDQTGPERGG